MNKIILTGRLTKDVELRCTAGGNYVADFTIAVNRPVSNDGERKADFILCRVWKKQAENLAKYQGKGSLIAVEGAYRTDSYTDDIGKTQYRNYVLATNIEYLEAKKQENASNENISGNDASNEEVDHYEEFGQQIAIDENDLPF